MHFMEPESSLPHSRVPATCPYPEQNVITLIKQISELKCSRLKMYPWTSWKLVPEPLRSAEHTLRTTGQHDYRNGAIVAHSSST